MKNKKLLYVNGCSCTFGDELIEPKKSAWPYLLARKLNKFVINHAVCSSSQIYVFRKTLNFIMKSKMKNKIFIIVGWPPANRIEIVEQQNIKQLGFFPYPWDDYTRRMNTFTSNLFYDNPNVYFYKILLENILKFYDIDYLFFQSFDYTSIVKKDKNTKCNITEYAFHNYAVIHNYPIGYRSHPLEKAHLEWTNYLYKHIKEHYDV